MSSQTAPSHLARWVEGPLQLELDGLAADALTAGLTALGVPPPVAMALSSLAAQFVENGGHLTTASIGDVLGEAIGGSVGGELGTAITEAVDTGKFNLSQYASQAMHWKGLEALQ